MTKALPFGCACTAHTATFAPPWPLTWVQRDDTSQPLRQNHGQGFEHQPIARTPDVDDGAGGLGAAAHLREAVVAAMQRGLQAVFFRALGEAQVPDIGIGGPAAALADQPRIDGIDQAVAGEFCEHGFRAALR